VARLCASHRPAQGRAESAASALAASEDAAQAAFAAVQAAQKSQQAEVTRLTAQRDAAATVLRSAQSHASVLAKARIVALRKAEAERRARAARAAAEAARRAQDQQHSGGGRPPVDSGGSRQWPDGTSTSTAAQRRAAIAFARAQLGKPYVAGGRGLDNYDCSGLTSAAYIHAGFPMIAYSKTQYASYGKIPVTQLQPGDLVFYAFDTSDWLTIHHVGLYVGGGQMIEAPHTGDHVKYQTIWLPGLMAYGTRP